LEIGHEVGKWMELNQYHVIIESSGYILLLYSQRLCSVLTVIKNPERVE